MPSCFIIMPVSTPEAAVPLYGSDPDHFEHVLEHLFKPAVTMAGFRPIAPIAQGADVIQAEIVKNLETADLVLCDISTLNPNVFFELGCRTALNKPVAYVKDELTRRIPFDTGIINHHTYTSSLAPWTLDEEIGTLSAHIKSSAERSGKRNMLWQYFGLQSTAHAAPSQGQKDDRLDYLVVQMESMRRQLQEQSNRQQWTSAAFDAASQSSWRESLESANPFSNTGPERRLGDMNPHWSDVLANAEHDAKQISKAAQSSPSRWAARDLRSTVRANLDKVNHLFLTPPADLDVERTKRALKQLQELQEKLDFLAR